MESLEFVKLVERDPQVISALRNALLALGLTHGARIELCGVRGSLNYEREMLGIRDALLLLGADPDEPTPLLRKGVDIE